MTTYSKLPESSEGHGTPTAVPEGTAPFFSSFAFGSTAKPPAKPRVKKSAADPAEHFRIAGAVGSLGEFYHRAAKQLSEQGLIAAWHIDWPDAQADPKVTALMHPADSDLWSVVCNEALTVVSEMRADGRLRSRQSSALPGNQLICASTRPLANPGDVICWLFDKTASLDGSIQYLTDAAAAAQWMDARLQLGESVAHQQRLAQWLQMVQNVSAANDLQSAWIHLTNGLKQISHVDLVALALCDSRGNRRRLAAISDVDNLDRASPSVQELELATCLPMDSRSECGWIENDSTPGDPTLEKIARAHGFSACVCKPLFGPGSNLVGSVMLASRSSRQLTEPQAKFIQGLVQWTGGIVGMAKDAKASAFSRLKDWLDQRLRPRARRWILMIAAAVSAVLFVPIPYRFSCDCELQPTVRRIVSVPFESVLGETCVRPGDRVTAGQILAKLDDRTLKTKLISLEAQLASESKRHKAALAKGDISDSQIASLECSRLGAEIELLRQRLAQLNVTSPIDGVVVSGDLEKVQGASLEFGQNLFEVAPLDELLVEVWIPEYQIQYSRDTMPVQLHLNAYPFRSWPAQLERIRPRAEVRDEHSVFVAEVTLPNDNAQLRPGMKGHAKICSDYRCLGWIVFHRAWESIRLWTSW